MGKTGKDLTTYRRLYERRRNADGKEAQARENEAFIDGRRDD